MEVKLGQKQFPVLKSRLLPASNFSSPNGLCLNPSKDKGQSSSKLWRGFPKDFHLLVGHKAVENKCRRTIECLGYAIVNQKICMSSQKVHIAVHPVYVVALVLLIAVCMRCIVDSFGHQLMKTWKHEGTNKANTRDYKQRNSRWKSAISNEMEVDVINCESQEDYVA